MEVAWSALTVTSSGALVDGQVSRAPGEVRRQAMGSRSQADRQ